MESSIARSHLAETKAYVHDCVETTSLKSQPVLLGSDAQNGEADDCLTVLLYTCCLRVLQKICEQLSAFDAHELEKAGLDVQKRILQEELGRLYLGGEGFASGEASRALENADDLRNNIVEILCGIGSLLAHRIPQWAGDLLPDLPVIEHSDLENLAYYIDKSKAEVSNDSDDEKYGSDIDDDSVLSLSGDYNLGDDLRSRVQLILDLTPTLESTIEHQKRMLHNQLYIEQSSFAASGPARNYISLVHDKFPKASQKLKERLGEANWQRHLNVRRRMNQAAGDGNGDAITTGSVFQPKTLFHDSGIGTTIAAKSQYAQTEASHTSFMSSIAQHEKGSLRVPPTPKEVGSGEQFKCYICGVLQTRIKNRISWKRHVFQDLLPYICTFPECKDELRQFPTRQAWADHEFKEHRMYQVWECSLCSLEFSQSTEWEDHCRESHPQCFSESRISTTISAVCRMKSKSPEEEKCYLCNTRPSTTRRAFITHIGKHLEEVALMALSREDADECGSTLDSHDDTNRPDWEQVSRSFKQKKSVLSQSEDIENWAKAAADTMSRTLHQTMDGNTRLSNDQLKILRRNGINPEHLSHAQFASFQAQSPAIQEKSIQVYAQNLRNQTKGLSRVDMEDQASRMMQSDLDTDREPFEADTDLATDMLRRNGINPEQLSQAQLASFLAQSPSIREESIQLYLRNQTQDHHQSLSRVGMKNQASPMMQLSLEPKLVLEESKEESGEYDDPKKEMESKERAGKRFGEARRNTPSLATQPSSGAPPNLTSPPSKNHVCLYPSCEAVFTNAYRLDLHRGMHFSATTKRFNCQYASVCGRSGEKTDMRKGGFTTEDQFIEHLRKVHGEDIVKGRKVGYIDYV